jgi:hypothetical protein
VALLLTGSTGIVGLLLGALLAGLLTAVLVNLVSRYSRTKEDSAIGIVFTALFALGIILISSLPRGTHFDLKCFLFGDPLAVGRPDLIMMSVVAPLVLWFPQVTGSKSSALIPWWRRRWGFPSADPLPADGAAFSNGGGGTPRPSFSWWPWSSPGVGGVSALQSTLVDAQRQLRCVVKRGCPLHHHHLSNRTGDGAGRDFFSLLCCSVRSTDWLNAWRRRGVRRHVTGDCLKAVTT